MAKRQGLIDGRLERADTPWKRAIGLMFRKEPAPLLISFEREARHAIWMLCMRFPIDLVFLDDRKRVITVYEDIRPISLDPGTWRIYRPEKPAYYALEVPAGWVRENRICKGDILESALI